MNWYRLISDKRLGLEEFHDPRRHSRSDFQRDYDRMIFSSPFRRLQNKTQVFPLPGSIFVHNRLTHSLEVSSVGRSMANETTDLLLSIYDDPDIRAKLHNIGDIVAAACLCHDLGNPPFGHSGEKTISTFFSEGPGLALKDRMTPQQWNDLTHFEGNANSFRLLSHKFAGRREGGFAMTYSTLASIVKYPYSSLCATENGKFGFFESEQDAWLKVAAELGIPRLDNEGRFARHPLVYLMEAADDICYQIMDMEDAHKLKIMPTQHVKELFMNFFGPKDHDRLERHMAGLDDPNEQIAYLRSNIIGQLVTASAREFFDNEKEILNGTYEGSLIKNLSGTLKQGYQDCSDAAYAHIYFAPEVSDIEIAGNRILTYLLSQLTGAVLNPEKNYSRLLLGQVPQQYETSAPTLYGRIQAVLDHVSGMTDVYALNLYRKLNGHSLPAV